MGIFDRFRTAVNATSSASEVATSSARGVRSPWVEGTLTRIVYRDIFGIDTLPVSRAEAMGVPAIARARHILTSDAARCPFSEYDASGPVADDSGSWLQSTSLAVSPQHRAVWTVDDLIFHGWSLWLCQREGDDPQGGILDAGRVPREWWRFGEDGRLMYGDEPIPAHQAILIPGFSEGIVAANPRTIRAARELEAQWAQRAQNPIPAVELHQNTPDELSDDEILALVNDWKLAIQDTGGAVAWTPHSIDVKPHGHSETDLLVQGRNAAAVDAARIVGVPAAMIDASNVNSSLTYETLSGRNLEYVDRSLAMYLGPIEARLSLDDVCAPGRRIRADTSAVTSSMPNPTGTTTED